MITPPKADGSAELEDIISAHRLADPVYVTRPTMPNLDDYTQYLRGIWERRWLTNAGPLHGELERKLVSFLGVEHLSLFCNGAIALQVAFEALRINSGEVITTPFSFPATAHVAYWSRVRPVFCDIDPLTFNIDPSKIERLIGPETRAILPVHVYGHPCDVEAIQKIAEVHGLHVVYDAAHAFGVRYKGRSLLSYGSISMLSFHATKLFTTIEGGALVCGSEAQRNRINFLKNFGIADEETVIGPGINGKMNEFQAAFGLLQLQGVAEEIRRRRALAKIYRDGLRRIPGIFVPDDPPECEANCTYFPILVDRAAYGMSRDDLYLVLRRCNILTRKYFYPLITHAPCYSALPSAAPSNLPVAERVAGQVLCLPMYGTLEAEIARSICSLIAELRVATSKRVAAARS